MKTTHNEFIKSPNKAITLLGMSGIGKTTLANKLPKSQWFHYSGDYRIGTKYLEEPILDNIKEEAMEIEFLADLLKTDSIYISSNITVDNLLPISMFLGKIGDPKKGGLSLDEFLKRQKMHKDAEIKAMMDVPEFIEKSRRIYEYESRRRLRRPRLVGRSRLRHQDDSGPTGSLVPARGRDKLR